MKRIAVILFGLGLALGLQARRQNVIFETDMGNDVDDALAIDMLYKFAKDGDIRLMAQYVVRAAPHPHRTQPPGRPEHGGRQQLHSGRL